MNNFTYIDADNNHVSKLFTEIFMNIIFNWSNIQQNEQIMSCLDMHTNTFCASIKTANPMMRDAFIQAHVLSITTMIILIIMQPIRTFNDIAYEQNNTVQTDDNEHESVNDLIEKVD